MGHKELYSYRQDTSPPFAGRFHVVSNQLIAVNGDTTRAHSYFLSVEGLNACLSGTYDDVVHTKDGWRFQKGVVTYLFPGGFPIAGNEAPWAKPTAQAGPRLALRGRFRVWGAGDDQSSWHT